MVDAGGIEQPNTWKAGPTFGRDAMIGCPVCNKKTRQFGSTYRCDSCFSEWHRDGRLKRQPPDVPDGVLFVWEDEYLAKTDVSAWGGKGLQRGNIIEI
jgi:hypothetical protein